MTTDTTIRRAFGGVARQVYRRLMDAVDESLVGDVELWPTADATRYPWVGGWMGAEASP